MVEKKERISSYRMRSDKGRTKTCLLALNDFEYDSRLRRVAASLASWGYQVVVLAEKSESTSDSETWQGVQIKRLKTTQKFWRKRRFLGFWLRAFIGAYKEKAQVYHAFDLDTLLPAALAAKLQRAKLIYETHELYLELEALRHRPVVRAVWSILERSLIARADSIITVNESIAEIYRRRYKISKPEVILSCPPLKEYPRRDLLRKQLEIPSDKKIILYQGVLRSGQGLFLLLELVEHLPEASLVFIGDGPLREDLRVEVEKRELWGRVFFKNRLPPKNLLYYTASGDLGMLLMESRAPNNFYALPNKVFEYMMAGVPQVVSNFPELKNFVEGTKIGVTVDVNNLEETITTVREILFDERELNQFRENCKRIAGDFNWENESEKLKKIYENLRL
ncbi:MAG: glycosyltransferase family 4 protein [Candidatus Zixiibacteriota bacterium]